MQQDTCFEECRYRDKKGKYKTSCPDYMELSWESDTGEVCITHDCAKRRSLLLMLSFDSRIVGLQGAVEQERNKIHSLVHTIANHDKFVAITQKD